MTERKSVGELRLELDKVSTLKMEERLPALQKLWVVFQQTEAAVMKNVYQISIGEIYDMRDLIGELAGLIRKAEESAES